MSEKKTKGDDGKDIFETALDSPYAMPAAMVAGGLTGSVLRRLGRRISKARGGNHRQFDELGPGGLSAEAALGTLAGQGVYLKAYSDHVTKKRKKK